MNWDRDLRFIQETEQKAGDSCMQTISEGDSMDSRMKPKYLEQKTGSIGMLTTETKNGEGGENLGIEK